MSGYWLGFRRNCRCNYGYPGNCSNRWSAHSVTPDNLCNRKQDSDWETGETGQVFLKGASLGSMMIPTDTVTGTAYHVASVNIQTLCFEQFHIKLCFSCNLITANAKISLGFQMFKQGNSQVEAVPISCIFDFRREKESSESNMVSFIACDEDSFKCDCCNYSVYAKITGMTTSGVTSIANSILSATLVEIPKEGKNTGEI